MKKMKRILSTLLAVTMLLGAISSLALIEVGAEAVSTPSQTIPIDKYITQKYNTAEDKVNKTMTLMSKNEKFELYVDTQSGEIALKEIASGNYLLSNPYDLASDTVSRDKRKQELLSQLLITYIDLNNQQKQETLNSYFDAAMNDQISVQKIKNGIRVEYTIGNEETRKLVPQVIMADSFQTNILEPLRDAYEKQLIAEDEWQAISMDGVSWAYKDVNNMRLFERMMWCLEYPFLETYKTEKKDENGNVVKNQRGEIQYEYPCFYVINEKKASIGSEMTSLEHYIKTYTDYTFEQMDVDHEITEFEEKNINNPVFKLALEYYLEDDGVSVRLPCNGLRYDMSSYRLKNISILPFMGAGSNHNAGFVYNNGTSLVKTEGYAFFPDGSGALFNYEEILEGTFTVGGRLYGEDYAYRTLTNNPPMQKAIRYPVYGAVSSEVIHEYTYLKDGVEHTEKVSNTVRNTEGVLADIAKLKEEGATILSENIGENATVYHRGYVAMIEEGDSMADLTLDNGSNNIGYTTIYNYFNPKPYDSYNLSDAISVASGGTVTEDSERKYTGSIKLHYTMLCDEDRAAEIIADDPKYTYFETSWLGMAEAYRARLTKSGVLSRLKAADVTADIPLYIEVFGALETQQTIATIPVNMMTPLTSFENVETMYKELSEHGIKNINFKMTGFANGGMYSTVPSSLKWEKAVGGKEGFKKLVANAAKYKADDKNANLGLYPDFDFAYIHKDEMFDSVYLDDDAVKSIDNRYASYRQYSVTQQTFVSFYQLAVSPTSYEKFYVKLLENYSDYGLKSLSVATLGTTLNSNFNEDIPLNREDSKNYTVDAFAYMHDNGYSLMSDGGNVYTLRYVDHILNAELDSSRHLRYMATVPFVGVVLHGSKQFAGVPLNEEGDVRYAMLRAIENGAAFQFVLSYQNTNELKKDSYLSQYYSIQYQIWKDDVISYYNELNNLLKDVQTNVIVDHRFLVGERVLDADELEAIIAEKLEEASRLEDIAQKEQMTAELIAIAEAWTLAYNADAKMQALMSDFLAAKSELGDAKNKIDESFAGVADDILAVLEAKKALNDYYAANKDMVNAEEKSEAYLKEEAILKKALDEKQTSLDLKLDFSKEALAVLGAMKALDDYYAANQEMVNAEEKSEEYLKGEAALKNTLADAKEVLNLKLKSLRDCTEMFIKLKALVNALEAEKNNIVTSLNNSVELVTNTSLYDDNQENRDVILDQIADGKTIVNSYLDDINAVFADLDIQYMEKVVDEARNTLDKYFDKEFEEGGAYVDYAKTYQKTFMEDFAPMLFDVDLLEKEFASDESEDVEDEDLVSDEDSFYRIDNRKIVLVSYGETNGQGKDTVTKSFILNYNTFAVRVEYDGIGYTIPSGDYIVINSVKN